MEHDQVNISSWKNYLKLIPSPTLIFWQLIYPHCHCSALKHFITLTPVSNIIHHWSWHSSHNWEFLGSTLRHGNCRPIFLCFDVPIQVHVGYASQQDGIKNLPLLPQDQWTSRWAHCSQQCWQCCRTILTSDSFPSLWGISRNVYSD